MRIDNTAFTMYMKCPQMYYERYEADASEVSPRTDTGTDVRTDEVLPVLRGIEPATDAEGRAFGTRFHELVEDYRRAGLGLPRRHYPTDAAALVQRNLRPAVFPDVESECQSTFAQYRAHYLGDRSHTVLAAEATHVIPIPGTAHELIVKIDAVVGYADGTIGPLDTKTESTPGNNSRENWAGRTQASAYLWALTQLYPDERVSELTVDVVTRGNSKRSPVFYRFGDIRRTPAQLEDDIRNIAWACDDIERSRASGWWRHNGNICKDGWRKCDYYDLHVLGRTEANLSKFRPAEAYLEI